MTLERPTPTYVTFRSKGSSSKTITVYGVTIAEAVDRVTKILRQPKVQTPRRKSHAAA